jgi:hypothetical protein
MANMLPGSTLGLFFQTLEVFGDCFSRRWNFFHRPFRTP